MKIRGLFYFLAKNHSIKNYTDGIFKKRLLRKNGPFSGSMAEKIFFCGGSQRGRAALDCCEARVDGRSWARVDGRSWRAFPGAMEVVGG